MSTEFQMRLYHFISEYIEQYQISPSFRDMTQALGISERSKSLITRSLRALSKEGKIVLKKQGRRLLITLTNRQLRLMGCISAGMPIEAIAESIVIELSSLFQNENQFALQVKGHSMREEGILDGDIIICQKSNTAKEGDIVVALIDQNNATLKRISFKEKGLITLIPANVEFKSQIYLPERVQIQGIYQGLVRLRGSL